MDEFSRNTLDPFCIMVLWSNSIERESLPQNNPGKDEKTTFMFAKTLVSRKIRMNASLREPPNRTPPQKKQIYNQAPFM